MTQLLQQINKPLAVPTRLNPHLRRRYQPTVKSLRRAISMQELLLGYLAALYIENRYLLPPRMKITPAIVFMEGFS